jgi:hypothetical protein
LRGRRLIGVAIICLVATACSSGPSSPDLPAPTITTTTEPPPEGLVVVRITNGSFRPSNLDVDLTETPIVRWVHEDVPEREYTITARNGEFESPLLTPEPAIYRYFSILGNSRIPGTVDTRPEQ